MSDLEEWQESFANNLTGKVAAKDELPQPDDIPVPPSLVETPVYSESEIGASPQFFEETGLYELQYSQQDYEIEETPQLLLPKLVNIGGLVFDREEAETAAEFRESKPRGKNQVCICGHNVKRHKLIGDEQMCLQSTFRCRCKNLVPLFEIQDSRCFMEKTRGFGHDHALLIGVLKHEAKGRVLTPLRDICCMKCDGKNGMLLPSPLTKDLRIANKDTGYNTILCSSCFALLR